MNLQNAMSYLARASSVSLGTGYDYTAAIPCSLANQLNLYVFYTKGSSDSLEVVVEFSDDATNWVSETNQVVSTSTETDYINTHTQTTTGNRRYFIPIMDNWVRFGTKATTSAVGASVKLIARIGTV